MTYAIEANDLVRRFGRLDAVAGLTFGVPAGSIFGVIGPNGAGKTTTIKLLMNLLRPTRGSAAVLGTDSRRLGPRQLQRIGYVSENQRLPGWMTPADLLAFCRPLYPTWDDELCNTLQAELRLPLSGRLGTHSRGTRMKAALLASLAYRPELVVLDEPFSGLDPLVRDELIRALLELTGDGPWTVLVSSHDIEELERLADWVAFLDGGRLGFVEQVSSLLRRFRQIEVIGASAAPEPLARPEWLVQGVAGRTLRLIDTRHADVATAARLAAAFPGAEVRASPLTLREIFVILARESRMGAGVRSAG